MNKLAILFAFTTAVFAGTTAHYALQLREARETTISRRAPLSGWPMSAREVSPTDTSESPVSRRLLPPPATDGAAQPPAEGEPPRGPPRFDRLAMAKEQLARLSDPRGRSEMKAAAKAAWSDRMYAMAGKLKLSREQFDALAEAVAEQTLQRQEATFRCMSTEGCDRSAVQRDDSALRDAVYATLGATQGERYFAYVNSMPERMQIERFATRLLNVEQLTETQSEQLITAFAEERKQYNENAKAQGLPVQSTFGMTGSLWATARPGENNAQLIESVTDYNNKLRVRAASILTAEQLAVYDEAQTTSVLQARERFRQRPSP